MKSLSGLTILSVLGISACTGPPEVGKLDPRPQTKTSPLDKLDAEKIPEETRKLLAVPELVAFIAAHDRAVGIAADTTRLSTDEGR